MAKKQFNHDDGDRKFMILLYPDSESYVCDEVLSKIIEYAEEWSYILHDKDIDSEENTKRAHYHVCVKWKNPRTRGTIANQIGIEKNYIERLKNWRVGNRYLLHMDDQDKYQYGLYYVESNFDFCNLVNAKESESIKVRELIFYIRTECKSMVDLADYALENNLWSEYRRNYTILKDYYYETKQKENETNGNCA